MGNKILNTAKALAYFKAQQAKATKENEEIQLIWATDAVNAIESTRAIFEYEFDCEENTFSIVSFKDKNATSVVIPAPVNTIKEKVFAENLAITEVTLPSTIRKIGDMAFINCSNLDTVSIAPETTFYGCFVAPYDQLPTIEVEAFAFCSSLNQAQNLIDFFTVYETAAFRGCSSIKDIKLRDTAVISEYLFADCHGLESVNFSGRVRTIGTNSFTSCTGLKSVEFLSLSALFSDGKEEVYTISQGAFSFCESLESISFDILKSLIIEPSAFYECYELKTVDFNINLPGIDVGESSFDSCGQLKSLYFPCSHVKFDRFAFADCDKLAKVSFDATQDDVEIHEESFLQCPNVTLEFLD